MAAFPNRHLLQQTATRIRGILGKNDYRRFRQLHRWVIFSALLDAGSLILVLPVIAAVTDKDIIAFHRHWGWLYRSMGVQSPNNFILWLMLFVVAAYCIKNALALFVAYKQAKTTHEIAGTLSERNLNVLLNKDYLFFRQADPGRLSHDIAFVPSAFASSILIPFSTAVAELLVLVIILVSLAIYKFQIFSLLALVLVPAFWLVYSRTRSRIYALGKERDAASAESFNRVIQPTEAFTDMRLLHVESFFVDRFNASQRIVNQHDARLYMLGHIPSRMIETMAMLSVAIILIVSLSLGTNSAALIYLMGVFVAAAFRVIPSLNRIIGSFLKLRNFAFTLDRLEAYLPQDKERKAPVLDEELKGSFQSLELTHVSFAYPDGDQHILADLDFTIKAGECIGIRGESGVGKTTFLHLLTGFISPTSGLVRINNQVPTDKDWMQYRHLIGWARSSVFAYNASLEANIALGIPENERNKARIAYLMQLFELDDLNELLNRASRPLGEKGTALSTGQLQRLGLARALYNEPSLLILDEATVGLDTFMAKKLLERLNRYAQENHLTVVMVSHQNEVLRFCDKIFTFENGRLVLQPLHT